MPERDEKPHGATKSRITLKPALVRVIVMKKKLNKPKIDDSRWIKLEDDPQKYMAGTRA